MIKKLGAIVLAMLVGAVLLFPFAAYATTPAGHTNYPNGFPNGVTIRGVPILNSYAGDVFYVDSGTGSDGNQGTYQSPFATVDYCIGRTTASNGDMCVVFPGHSETFTAADGFDVDVAGVAIVGLGVGANMPTFNFTDTDATVAIGAANVTLYNLRFVAGISAVVIGIAVEAAGDNAVIAYNVFPEPTTSTFEFVDAIDLASGADGVTIVGNIYFHADATGPAHFIEAGNGVNNDLQILDNYIYGEFSVAAIWSDTIDLEVLIDGNNITNLTNGQHCIEFTTTATGLIKNTICRSDAIATAIDPGSMGVAADVYWEDDATADDSAVQAIAPALANHPANTVIAILAGANGIGTYPAAAVPGNAVSLAEVLRDLWDGVRNGTGGTEPATNSSVVDAIGHTGGAFLTTGLGYWDIKTISTPADEVTQDLFLVAGGPIQILSLVGYVDVIIGAVVTTAIIILDATAGASYDLEFSTAVAITSDVVGTMYMFSDANPAVLTPLTPGAASGGTQLMKGGWFSPPGMIEQTMSADPGGAAGDHITWYLTYRPLVTGVTVTAQ